MLLAGVNDSVHIQRELVHKLVRIRVRPYYLYQCDLVRGRRALPHTGRQGHRDHRRAARAHLRLSPCPTTSSMRRRRRQDPADAKLRGQHGHKVVLRNYEGFITTYEEPTTTCPVRRRSFRGERPEPGQPASTACWRRADVLKPEDFDEVHDRRAFQHRLKDPSKWVPLGIGRARRDQTTGE